jgi:hypothetical protein
MRTAAVLLLPFTVGALSCSQQGRPAAPSQPATSPSPTSTTEPSSTPQLAVPGEEIEIPGTANIFVAGRAYETGGGTLPPGWELPPGAGQLVVFKKITGGVAHLPGASEAGPEGRGFGETDVSSYEGISGIVHKKNIMFLVGVFLTDDPPSNPSPERLDVTKRPSADIITPQLGQVFKFRIPSGPTRLYVGFADACDPLNFVGPPGCYFNNSGFLTTTIEVTK